jgi:4,5:9,10-diseco-3-hydroxy-5,9,17-trioxoandrosta-1(10),2-diene-4-oate hydrolase
MARLRKLVPDGVREEFATVTGHRMRYLTAGSGPPLLLIHGLTGFSFSFSENIVELAKSSTVYAPDLFNLGWSERIKVPCSLPAAADQMFHFLDAVSVPSANVLGSSHGGAVALTMTIRRPQRVKNLVLVSPAHPFAGKVKFTTGTIALPIVGELLGLSLKLAPRFTWPLILFRIYGKPSRALPGTVEGYMRPLQTDGTIAHALRLLRCWRHDFAQLAEELRSFPRLPVLLIWGDKDKIVPYSTASALARWFDHSEMVTIPTAGHLPYEELPEQFNAAVTQFLDRHRG